MIYAICFFTACEDPVHATIFCYLDLPSDDLLQLTWFLNHPVFTRKPRCPISPIHALVSPLNAKVDILFSRLMVQYDLCNDEQFLIGTGDPFVLMFIEN